MGETSMKMYMTLKTAPAPSAYSETVPHARAERAFIGAILKTIVSPTAIRAMTRSCAFLTAYLNSFSKTAENSGDTNGRRQPAYFPSPSAAAALGFKG